MADTYAALETAVLNNSQDGIIKNLKTILTYQNIEFKNLSTLITLLKNDNNEILRLTSQAIAESGKITENRNKLSDKVIIELLVHVLNTNKNVLCETQVCRALGNMCYDNDEVRSVMNENNSVKIILNLLETNYQNNDSTYEQLMKIACGLLSNYLNTNTDGQKEALRLNILTVIEKIINLKFKTFSTNEVLFIHLLHVLSMVNDCLVDNWFSNDLLIYVINILEISVNPEISESCLELLHAQAENDDIKLLLARKGLCELLYNLLEQHKSLVNDEESRALLKLACDLIVLILTEDQSMTFLYSDGTGKVYKDMICWLSSDDVDLMITGVLAIGNFARNDKHCIKMVQDGLAETLLSILSKHNKVNDDIRLQHALLSALRNLVIPAQNKSRMISHGLVDIILPMLTIDQYPVIFKLLGTLRMVIDGQEKTALEVISRKDLLERLVNFCYNSDHPGVSAESQRLLAWLIKHCHSSEPYVNIIQVDDCVRCLVEMIPSSHAVMQNEALLALNLLCEYEKIYRSKNSNDQNNKNLESVLVKADVGKFVTILLNKYSLKMKREVIENLLSLFERICEYKEVKQNLKTNEVSTSLKKCLEREDLKEIYGRINKIISSIDSG